MAIWMNLQRSPGVRAVPLAVALALLAGCGDSDLPEHQRDVLAQAAADARPATTTVRPSGGTASGTGTGSGGAVDSGSGTANGDGGQSPPAPSTSDAGPDSGTGPDAGPEPDRGAALPAGTDGDTGGTAPGQAPGENGGGTPDESPDGAASPDPAPVEGSGQDAGAPGNGGGPTDGGGAAGDADAGTEGSANGGANGGADAGPDVGPDAGTDGGTDAEPDVEPDGGADTGTDGAATGGADGNGQAAPPGDLDPDGSKAAGSPVRGLDLADYDLVFEDEFDGGALDAAKWKTAYEYGDLSVDEEQQYYVDALNEPDFGYDPFVVAGGELVITAAETPDGLRSEANGKDWLSGVISTADSFAFERGYAEMRVDLPEGAGLGSVLTLIAREFTGLQPMIFVGRHDGGTPGELEHDYEFTENGERKTARAFTVEDATLSEGFHTVGVSWSESGLIYYVDGEATYRIVDDEGRGNLPAQPLYLVANLAIGGVRRSDPDAATPRPATLVIDRVRVWQPR